MFGLMVIINNKNVVCGGADVEFITLSLGKITSQNTYYLQVHGRKNDISQGSINIEWVSEKLLDGDQIVISVIEGDEFTEPCNILTEDSNKISSEKAQNDKERPNRDNEITSNSILTISLPDESESIDIKGAKSFSVTLMINCFIENQCCDAQLSICDDEALYHDRGFTVAFRSKVNVGQALIATISS